ncbi:MAG: AAA family ATPase [Proteobacteria bacterium]|nr:AAA family ATPase [Pseudomonadota bacterium]
MYKRILKIDLPKKQSAFLWGARKTGKSTYLKENFPNSLFYDLLKSDMFFTFSKSPFLFREEICAQSEDRFNDPVIIDEIQKIPSLLDEIHWLIENTPAHFILCGSSARKLRRVGVNLLGGRAWSYYFFPLVYPEIVNFNLLKVFSHGTIPSHYDALNYKKSLKSYTISIN